jgi:hypothetical protein
MGRHGRVVAVPASDIDRAITCLRDRLGSAVDHDPPIGSTAGVEHLTPPTGTTSLLG